MIATSEWILLDQLYLNDGILEDAITILVSIVKDIVELYFELFDLLIRQHDVFILLLLYMYVKVGHKVVDVGAD